MKKSLVIFFLFAITGCFSDKPESPPAAKGGYDYGGLIGHTAEAPEEDKKKKVDEMLIMQQKQVERQRKELEDIKRQQYYDQKYNQYLSEHK